MELIIIILGLVLDRATKILSVKTLYGKEGIVIIKNILSLSYLENRGAAFGILQNKQNILAIITLVVVIGVIYYLYKYKPKSKFLRVGIALILGGAIGNLFDRLYYRYVVDFIYFHYKDIYAFPTFNVADIMVVIGTIMVALYILRDDKQWIRKNL